MQWTVTEEEAGQEVLEFLARCVPAAPIGYLNQLLKKDRVVKSDGVAVARTYRLQPGDRISLPDSARLREFLMVPVADKSRPKVLYESREILAVDKPAGLAVHSSVGHEQNNLTQQVLDLLAERGDRFSVAPIHRLDVGTSGPVLFGKGKQACAELGRLFMRRSVEKCYLALVAGRTAGAGRFSGALLSKGKVRSADTDFFALKRSESASFLQLQIGTGRQHQIRRHLAAAGHPIFGDGRYGGPAPPHLPRMCLHCARLSFVDPFSAAPLTVESPWPDELVRFAATVFDDVGTD